MTAGRRADERWECLPLDLDLDFDGEAPEPDQHLQPPAGCHLVILRGGHARIAVDLPDIDAYGNRTA